MRRAAEVPKARMIIQTHLRELMEWHEMRKHVPVLKQVKIKLQEIHGSPLFEQPVPDNTALHQQGSENPAGTQWNGFKNAPRKSARLLLY